MKLFSRETLKPALDKLFPVLLFVAVTFFVGTYADFIGKHGVVGAMALLLCVLVAVFVWHLLTEYLCDALFRRNGDEFIGTWLDITWPHSKGRGVPADPSMVHQTALICVWRDERGELAIYGQIYPGGLGHRSSNIGTFSALVVSCSDRVLKYEFRRSADDGPPEGYGEYHLLLSASGPTIRNGEWNGYFFSRGQDAYNTRAVRLSDDERGRATTDHEVCRLLDELVFRLTQQESDTNAPKTAKREQ